MADDQVKYSDLIANDVLSGLEVLNQALVEIKTTMAGVKAEAAALGVSLRSVGTATKEQQQATAADAAAVEGLSKKVKQLSDEEARLEAVSRRYKKLTDEQVKSVDAFQQAMQGTAEEQIKAASAIDVQVKSYNELQATYNALKDTLNAMTTAERESSQAGKVMTTTAMTIRDKMNELQKATGNYTLQVGKYKAAFDGLGFSFMQIAREAPSALNLNQFFLAISNNLPMFFDQIDRFKTEQKEIKQTLADLAAQGKQTSDEYIKIANQQTTVFKRLTQAIFSMQGAVLVFTMLLRFLPKIVGWFKEMFSSINKGVKDLDKMKKLVNEMEISVSDAVSEAAVELAELNRRLADVTEGSVEWMNITERIKEIIGDSYDITNKMPNEIEQVTSAYIAQAEQLARNKFVIDKIAESAENAFKIERGKGAGSASEFAKIFGIDEESDDYDLIDKFFSGRKKWFKEYGAFVQRNVRQSEIDALMKKYAPTYSNEELEEMWRNYYKAIPTRGSGGDKPKEPTEQNTTDRYWEAQKALVKAQYEGYEQERQLARVNRDESFAELTNWYNEQQKAYEENRKNGFITQQEYDAAIIELDRQRDAIRIGIMNEYVNEVNGIDEKEAEERRKAEEKAAKEAEKAAKDGAKAELKAAVDGWAKYKAKLVEEGKTRKQIVEAEVAAEIARLNLMLKLNRDVNGEIMSDEQKDKVQEWINLLEKLQQTGNYGDYKPGQFMGKGGANVTNERKNYANIWEVLGIDMDNNQVSALNSVFDQAKEALNSWMDARKEAAEQAKELADDEVSAAENALNREIELRNQGYANDVALREKELADAKEKQKQAIELQAKYKKEQVLLDAAMQTSSMITASANIMKQFPNPALWIPMLATLWGTFAYAKVKSYQSAEKSITFGEGGSMLLEGGSHASGHDINLGVGPDGSNLRAEGGEYFAVINKRSSRKYGSQIPAVVNALNSGMFEDRYIKTSDAVGLLPQVIRADNGSYVDLSKVEGGVSELVKQGESRWSTEGEYRVMRYKNLMRRVRVN